MNRAASHLPPRMDTEPKLVVAESVRRLPPGAVPLSHDPLDMLEARYAGFAICRHHGWLYAVPTTRCGW